MIRVLVVEDSAVQRAHLVRMLAADGDIEVVGEAEDAQEAIACAASLRPDVITLDLQLPGGGGQHVIEQVMAHSPVPILVLSGAIAGRESTAAVDALVAGAVDVLPKPRRWDADVERTVRERVRVLRGVTVLRHPRGSRRTGPVVAQRRTGAAVPVVAIAASTGGPNALAEVLGGLGVLPAAVLIVQHLHPDFVDGLVTWMARVSAMPVELAGDGMKLRPGVVLVAPGGVHLTIGDDDRVVLDPEPETLHRPSADALFRSLDARRRAIVAVVLTGMGDDGADGLLGLRRGGAVTIAQDESTSAVFGMPRAAARAGGAVSILPLDRIAGAIVAAVGS